MKSFIFAMMLGASCVSLAAVTTPEIKVKTATVKGMDMSKLEMMTRPPKSKQGVDPKFIQEAQKYDNVITLENAKSTSNMMRMAQNNPQQLLYITTGVSEENLDEAGLSFATKTAMDGTQPLYHGPAPETDDPAEIMASIQTPDLTGPLSSMRESKDEIKLLQKQALKRIEVMSKQKLEDRSAPIQMPMTMEDWEELGIDKRDLPDNFEEIMKQQEEGWKLYKQQRAAKRKQEEAAEKAKESGTQTAQPNVAAGAVRPATQNPVSAPKTSATKR